MNTTHRIAVFLYAFFFSAILYAQHSTLPYGDMDTWRVRQIKESAIIGGETKYIYELAKGDTLKGNVPFTHELSKSIWGTSSTMAVVSGITKSSTTVFPEKRGSGYAARMETKIEKVKALGIINISVLATGSVYLGHTLEPVRDTKNPMAKINMGIPYTDCPESLVFDYKFIQGSNNGQRVKVSGMGSPQEVPGQNCAEVCLILQRRWEDSQGNVYAERVGTAWLRISKSTSGWVNAHAETIHYGDITATSYYKPYMALSKGGADDRHCLNTKGESVPIKELGWAPPGTRPTHIMLNFSSGFGGAYVGSPGAALSIDNVCLRMK